MVYYGRNILGTVKKKQKTDDSKVQEFKNNKKDLLYTSITGKQCSESRQNLN